MRWPSYSAWSRCSVGIAVLAAAVVLVILAIVLDAVNGKMGPYAAVFVLATGILLSNFAWNTVAMKKPFVGPPVGFRDYFAGSFGTHLSGVMGGVIWGVGMSFNLIASGRAGFAISCVCRDATTWRSIGNALANGPRR
jgi:hypothetical protein